MDGLHHIANPGSQMTVAGTVYCISPVVGTLAALAEAERYLVGRRPDPLQAVAATIERFPREYREPLLKLAVEQAALARRRASQHELWQFFASHEGAAFLFWVGVRDRHPEVDSPQKAAEALAALRLDEWEELQRRLDEAAGLSDLKNSTGRTSAAGTPAETETHAAPPAASLGPGSTAG